MEGKIILKYDKLGYIEYDVDSRISYLMEINQQFDIGDKVSFDIIKKKVTGSETLFDRAVNLKIIERREENLIRLSKVLREFGLTLDPVCDFLSSQGIEIERRPTVKISEGTYTLIANEFSINEEEEKYSVGQERGSVIDTKILQIIKPSTIVLEFFNGRIAILPLQNLDWSIPKSEEIFDNFKIGDRTKVVVLENIPNKPVLVSRKHLFDRPSEESSWQDLKIGDILDGTIVEVLNTQIVLSFPNNLFGTALIKNDSSLKKGDKLPVQVLSKSSERFLLITTVDFEKPKLKKSKSKRTIDSGLLKPGTEFKHEDKSLENAQAFFSSLYFDFCEESESNNEKQFFQDAFDENENLFDLAFSSNLPLFLQFTEESWQGEFLNKFLPHLTTIDPKIISPQDAIAYLSKQKYWFNLYAKSSERHYWTLFNPELYISGFVTEEPDERFFFVSKLEIGRKNKDLSFYKEKSQQNGCFLYDSEIKFLTHGSNRPIDKPYSELFDLLLNKSEAFLLYGELRKRTGAILMEEGESLKIFDKFLEYQEDKERRKNKQRVIKISSPISKIPAIESEVSFETMATESLMDIYNSSDLERVLVSIKVSEESGNRLPNEEELIWFHDAEFEIENNKARFHFSEMDKSLQLIEGGFYVEPKASLKQWKVQRKVIQDFFNKRINISHIESLFLKPDRIAPPKRETFEFFNPLLNKARAKDPVNKQVKSVVEAVGNKNIYLIQGPPGTGKTTVIAEIVQQLVGKGEKVLVTSQTHVAVDNVLEKLESLYHLTLVRFGNRKRIMPNLEKFHVDELVKSLAINYGQVVKTNIKLIDKKLEMLSQGSENTLDELSDYLNQITEVYPKNFINRLTKLNKDFISVIVDLSFDDLLELRAVLDNWKAEVAGSLEEISEPIIYDAMNVAFATCIGVRTDKGLFDRSVKFDTVIIDEAGKANLSESIAAVSMAEKVILVGDHEQLPPYIDRSLIDPSEANSFPNSKKFNREKFSQHAINHALTTSLFEFLVNKNERSLFPDSNIEMLNLQYRMHPDIGKLVSRSFYKGQVEMGESTINNVLPLNYPFNRQIVFVDTSKGKMPYESLSGTSFKNDTEANCIAEIIVPKLISERVNKDQFAIIAPYKAQVNNIVQKLKSQQIRGVEVATLDSFQGMEFDIIIFSFTRSRWNTYVGFLDDARRLNVALSRAKKKLILVGNSSTLTSSRSHYDGTFPYTSLYKNIVKISQDEEKGNFVLINDLSKKGRQSRSKNKKNNRKSEEEKFDIKLKKLRFFTEHSQGQVIIGFYKFSTKTGGHFFTIFEGLDSYLYSPNLNGNEFEKGKPYKLRIKKLSPEVGKISVELEK